VFGCAARGRRREVASMLTTAGLRRSATSAKLTTPAMPGITGRSSRALRIAETVGADVAELGESEPVTTMPTRNDTHAVNPTVKYAKRLVTSPTL
jgi:hypothetical protein